MRKTKLFLKYFEKLGVLNFLSFLFQRLVRKDKILSLKVPNLSRKVLIRNIPNDIQLFTQIFINQEYNVDIKFPVNTMIDCGANIGLASLYFLSKYPKAKIIAVEPESDNFLMLQKNLEHFKNVTCLKKGIWNKTANLEIVDFSSGEAGFRVDEFQQISENTIQAVTIEDLINEFELQEIDILKIDIEGSEEQVFLEEPVWLKKVNIIFCEIHEIMKPGLTFKIRSLLAPYFNYFINGEYYVFTRK